MPSFIVSPAAPHELLAACRLLFAGRVGPDREKRAERCRDRLLAGGEGSGLFVARAEGRLCAAALVQSLPGALGVAWLPRGDSAEAEDLACAAACGWLASRGVKVCQAFALADEIADVVPLERRGFRRVTQLTFLRRELSPGVPTPTAGGLTFVSDGPAFADEFAATLLATHEGTLDCPELNAPRTPEEVLKGFVPSASGEWYLARRNGEPVGVAMLEPGEEEGVTDLTYLGVVPKARGHGIGAEVLEFAVAEAARAGARVLNVSVDVRNEYAMRLYARHGFTEYDRREVWLAQFH